MTAIAQSHPSWWNNASPNATALVGIDWQAIQNTPVADAVEAELWGDMGFPDLPCLRHARQIVISSPELLALASAPCPALRSEARSFRVMNYRGTEMYFATEKGMLSIARLNDQVLMIGQPDTLQVAIDRVLANSRDYSPLLARAAQFNGKDLWVVAARLPDELADRFVPLNVEAMKMEGSASFRNGLELHASITADSEKSAGRSAEKLQKDAAGMPSLFRGMRITHDGDTVLLALEATREQVLASMSGGELPPAPLPAQPVVAAAPEPVKIAPPKPEPAKVALQPIVEQPVIEKPVIEKPVEKPVEKTVEKPKPQVVRIFGLDDGPREIVLPPPVKNR